MAWQIFAKDGQPLGPPQRRDGVPVWSLPAALAEPDGSFTVLH